MEKLLKDISAEYNYYVEHTNNCAGYFIESQFKNIDYVFESSIIEKMHNANIKLEDFSEYIQKLCNGDYSKLLMIILFGYNVEV